MNSTRIKRKQRGWTRICSLLMIVGSSICLIGCKESKDATDKRTESLPQIEAAVSRLLTRYQIDEKSIRTRTVASGDKKFARRELRVSIPPEFNTLNFNRELSQGVSEFGVSVIATEKSEDKSVTMHIKKDDVIVESIVFVVKKE